MNKIVRSFEKLRQLGFKRSFSTVLQRVRKGCHQRLLRSRASLPQPEHSIDEIFIKHSYPHTFEHWLERQRERPKLPLQDNRSDAQLMSDVQEIVRNAFDLLGSGKQYFNKPPWHTDIRLKAQQSQADAQFDATSFFADIRIEASNRELGKDIKVPWELSRCAHLMTLARAYERTQDITYVDTFCAHVDDWLIHNRYLHGINWMNPMEVALRAIHWIIAFDYFKSASSISITFWQRFVASLYDHLYYLEHNWEWYDSRTNNHYLSDLVGYYFLLCFFVDLDLQLKRSWCIQEIMQELDKQVGKDGLLYEGSTHYHRFVTELVALFSVCAKQMNELPQAVDLKQKAMQSALSWLTPFGGLLVTIGDDDSGALLKNELPMQYHEDQEGIKEFGTFGISVIKTKQVHCTLRHHVYHPLQPSGHFHNDALSITLAVNGMPIIVDPGSYVYTASLYWRNYFRAAAQHNGIYLPSREPVPLTDDLFSLQLPKGSYTGQISRANDDYEMVGFHELYPELQIHRRVVYQQGSNRILCEDFWHALCPKTQELAWHLMLHSSILAEQQNDTWYLYRGTQEVARITSDLPWRLEQSWLALGYGVQVATWSLRAKMPIACTQAKTMIRL